MILVDGDTLSRDGKRLRLSEVIVNGSKSPEPQSYSRIEMLIDCDAQLSREQFRVWFDSNGTLVDVSDEMPASQIYPSNPYDRPVVAACQKFPLTPTNRVYTTLAAALEASATGEPTDPR